MREVRCLTPDKKHSLECDSNTKPEQEQFCNTIPCSPQVQGWCECWYDIIFMWVLASFLLTCLPYSLITDENCQDRRHNCVMVVQARLCVYSYYKTACCASCTHNAQRAKRHWSANQLSRIRSKELIPPLKWQVCRNGHPRVDTWRLLRLHSPTVSRFIWSHTLKAAMSHYQLSVYWFIRALRAIRCPKVVSDISFNTSIMSHGEEWCICCALHSGRFISMAERS